MTYTTHYIHGIKPYVPNFNINPEDDIITPEEYKYSGEKSYKTPKEIIDIYNQTGWVPHEPLDFSKLFPKQKPYGSGLVRAPKFGVKHLK